MPNFIRAKKLSVPMLVSMALILAACGGGGGSGTPPPPADPDPSGLGPDSTGRYADARGFYPDAAGRYPDSHGLYPNASGVYPTNAEAGMFTNEFGTARSYSTAGAIDTSSANPFFKSFGNGRTCASCHVQGEGFSITPKGLQARFDSTNGTDPIFLPNDGSNSPSAPVGTVAEKRTAYSLLLNKGLIRVGIKMPATAEFALDSVSDPYNFASATELSLFRRPLPSTNLRFLASVMWDSRETVKVIPGPAGDSAAYLAYPRCIRTTFPAVVPAATATQWNCYEDFNIDLKNQANNATLGHAQAATALTPAEQEAIRAFEMSLFSAQEYDKAAGFLTSANVKGGTKELTTVDYYFDINSVFGDPKTGLPSATTKLTVMQLYEKWLTTSGTKSASVAAARASIARGQDIFNTRTFKMVGVGGTRTTTVTGATCTNCHSVPQVGSLAQPNLFAIGVGDPAFSSSADLPTYTFVNTTTGANAGKKITVQDPGLALQTGKWADMGKFKVSALRGLAMRPPYFHDGSAATIEDTIAFYIKRFTYDTPLTAQDIADLAAFLKSL